MPDLAEITHQWLEALAAIHRGNLNRNNGGKWRWVGNAALLLDRGKSWPLRSRPEDIEVGLPKEYHKNAWTVVEEFEGKYTYCEGYVCCEDVEMPVEHAWVVDESGFAVEVTFERSVNSYYFGLPFKREYVNQVLKETSMFGVLENFTQGYPLLRGAVRLEDVVADIAPGVAP